MCGIISYFSKETKYDVKIERLLRNMIFVDTLRGYHSTGLIFESGGDVEFIKKAVNGADFIEMDVPAAVLTKHHATRYIIGHNRAATLGKIKSANAHPFQYDHITGVHNGTLDNHRTLGGETHEVDSAMLYSAFATLGAADVLPRVKGDYNLIWHDSTDDTIHQVRNENRPYTFAKLKGYDTIVGASEKGMLKWLIQRNGLEMQFCWNPIEHTEYVFDLSAEGDLCKPTMIEHEAYKPPAVVKHVPKQQKGALKGVPNTKDGALEFFLDSYSRTYSAAISFFGWDYDGVEVEISNCHENEFELDQWYIGVGYWDGSNGGRWRVNPLSVKVHPAEAIDSDDDIHICMLCTEDKKEVDVLFIDNAPICYGCAAQQDLKPEEFDAGQENKVAELREVNKS